MSTSEDRRTQRLVIIVHSGIEVASQRKRMKGVTISELIYTKKDTWEETIREKPNAVFFQTSIPAFSRKEMRQRIRELYGDTVAVIVSTPTEIVSSLEQMGYIKKEVRLVKPPQPKENEAMEKKPGVLILEGDPNGFLPGVASDPLNQFIFLNQQVDFDNTGLLLINSELHQDDYRTVKSAAEAQGVEVFVASNAELATRLYGFRAEVNGLSEEDVRTLYGEESGPIDDDEGKPEPPAEVSTPASLAGFIRTILDIESAKQSKAKERDRLLPLCKQFRREEETDHHFGKRIYNAITQILQQNEAKATVGKEKKSTHKKGSSKSKKDTAPKPLTAQDLAEGVRQIVEDMKNGPLTALMNLLKEAEERLKALEAETERLEGENAQLREELEKKPDVDTEALEDARELVNKLAKVLPSQKKKTSSKNTK